MTRKKFILMAGVLLAGVTIPVFISHRKNAHLYRPLIFPESLSRLFDKDTIRDVGIAYRSKNSSESDVSKLKQLLLTDTSGKMYNENEKFAVREMINRETTKDFETGRTTLVNGWILSLTEVRQCALYSLTEA